MISETFFTGESKRRRLLGPEISQDDPQRFFKMFREIRYLGTTGIPWRMIAEDYGVTQEVVEKVVRADRETKGSLKDLFA